MAGVYGRGAGCGVGGGGGALLLDEVVEVGRGE